MSDSTYLRAYPNSHTKMPPFDTFNPHDEAGYFTYIYQIYTLDFQSGSRRGSIPKQYFRLYIINLSNLKHSYNLSLSQILCSTSASQHVHLSPSRSFCLFYLPSRNDHISPPEGIFEDWWLPFSHLVRYVSSLDGLVLLFRCFNMHCPSTLLKITIAYRAPYFNPIACCTSCAKFFHSGIYFFFAFSSIRLCSVTHVVIILNVVSPFFPETPYTRSVISFKHSTGFSIESFTISSVRTIHCTDAISLKPSRKRNPGCIRYILGGGTALAPFNFLKRPATKYDV